jgi:hypothetical protein
MTSKLAPRAPGGPGIESRWTHGAKERVFAIHSRRRHRGANLWSRVL